eukprot:5806871-Prymnesium_polylepis.1
MPGPSAADGRVATCWRATRVNLPKPPGLFLGSLLQSSLPGPAPLAPTLPRRRRTTHFTGSETWGA